jgi:hypothetical protein
MFEYRILLAGVDVVSAPANYEFRDMGFDATTGEVGIVGYEVAGAVKTAKLFELNAAKNGFVAQTLVGLGNPTYVYGISSDASRIAGVSKSAGSIDIGEGTTWLRSAPGTAVAIGYVSGSCANTSEAYGAWKDGVVGQCGGGARAIKWTQPGGIVELGNQQIAVAFDVNSNGNIRVGYSTHEVSDVAAYYWDNAGIHRLSDNLGGATTVQSIAYAISPSGNYIGGAIAAEDGSNDGILQAAVWDSTRNLIPLADSLGQAFQGRVLDVSDLGYAVGETRDGKGFIWHPSFDGVQSSFKGAQIFEDWLLSKDAGYTPQIISKGVEAVAEDRVNGKLLFALSDYETPGASFFVTVSGINFVLPPSPFSFSVVPSDLSENSQISVTLVADPVGFAREIAVSFTADARLSVPQTLTFPANADELTFQIAAADDLLLQGDQPISLSFLLGGFDSLEATFQLLDDEADFPFSNPFESLDVNGDKMISPIDVLLIINALNANGGGTLVWDGSQQPVAFYDTNRNNSLEPLDALLIINYLNSIGSSGEGPSEATLELRKRCFFATDEVDDVFFDQEIDWMTR